jgi:HAD superfamily hydrolase (TIGR01509 family)
MMPRDNRVILFDFFGVVREDGLLKFLYDHGLTFTGKIRAADEARCAGTITRAQYLDDLAAATGESGEYILKYMLENSNLDHGTLDVVSRLRKNGYKTVLASNCTDDTLKYIKNNHVDEYFDDMVLSFEVGITKPDLRFFKFLLQELGIAAAEAIFIDDKAENTDAASNIGITSILFTTADDLVVELRKLGVKI